MVVSKAAKRMGLALLALVAVLVPVLAIQQDGPEVIVATAAKPAELAAAKIARAADRPSPGTLALSVVGYAPPRSGTVTAVVRLENGRMGVTRELGRFGLFPDAPFTAETPASAQRFGFPLRGADLPLLDEADTRIVIALEPSVAGGDGARMVFGGAELPR